MGRPRKNPIDDNLEPVHTDNAPMKTVINDGTDEQDEPIKQGYPAGVETETSTDEEYKLEVVKDHNGRVDPFFLSYKDPNYAYRFLRDDPKNLTLKTGNMLFQRGGWQIVSRDHAIKRLKIPEKFISTDGLVRRGDTILAFMPKKLFDEKERHKAREANEPITQVERLIKKGDPSAGGAGQIHPSMKGFQTETQLGGNFKER